MKIIEQREPASIPPPSDRRAAPRFKAASLGTVTNITRIAEQKTALILDMSTDGLRIETTLAVSPRDALRIDLADMTLLAEAIYCERTAGGTVIGLKLFHTLNHELVRRHVEPELWER